MPLTQSYLKRKPKSDVAGLFVGVTSTDKMNRPKVLTVPGSNGKKYRVILRRSVVKTTDNPEQIVITSECAVETSCGHINCPGNGRGKGHQVLCYHSRAAIDFAIEHQLKNGEWVKSWRKGSWCETYEDAVKLNQMKRGQIVLVKSWQSKAIAWVVMIGVGIND